MTQKKKKWGGARLGAGRSKRTEREKASVQIACRLTPFEAGQIQTYSRAGESLSTTLRRLAMEFTMPWAFWLVQKEDVDSKEGCLKKNYFRDQPFGQLTHVQRNDKNVLFGLLERYESRNGKFLTQSHQVNQEMVLYSTIKRGDHSFVTFDGLTLWEITDFPTVWGDGRWVASLWCKRVEIKDLE